MAGVLVAVSGALSGIFVVIANVWMNTPTGFDLVDGRPVNIDPIAAMRNPAAFAQTLHMTLAAYAATGFVVAGIHALRLLPDPRNAFHRRALAVALLVGAPAAVLQPLSGDLCARVVSRCQPTKLAAMEGQIRTEVGAPWLTPFCFGAGVLTLALFAFLAAVYLTVEAREVALQEDFRRRALGTALAVFATAGAHWHWPCWARRTWAAVSPLRHGRSLCTWRPPRQPLPPSVPCGHGAMAWRAWPPRPRCR
jgi:hypothetical protein